LRLKWPEQVLLHSEQVHINLELVMGGAASVGGCLLGGRLTRLEVLPVVAELIRVVEVVKACLLFLLRWLPHQVLHQLA